MSMTTGDSSWAPPTEGYEGLGNTGIVQIKNLDNRTAFCPSQPWCPSALASPRHRDGIGPYVLL